MKTEEIARRLVELCRQEKWEAAQKELYAPNAVSIEPRETPGFAKETKGLPALLEKGKKFSAMVEKSHSVKVSDPVVAGNAFACTLDMDLTMKGQGRMQMAEVCVYEVKDGKIVSERFFM
jgi:ketosteroid isomerase-like protein